MRRLRATLKVDFVFDQDTVDSSMEVRIKDAIKKNINGWQYQGSLEEVEILDVVNWKQVATEPNRIYKEDLIK